MFSARDNLSLWVIGPSIGQFIAGIRQEDLIMIMIMIMVMIIDNDHDNDNDHDHYENVYSGIPKKAIVFTNLARDGGELLLPALNIVDIDYC